MVDSNPRSLGRAFGWLPCTQDIAIDWRWLAPHTLMEPGGIHYLWAERKSFTKGRGLLDLVSDSSLSASKRGIRGEVDCIRGIRRRRHLYAIANVAISTSIGWLGCEIGHVDNVRVESGIGKSVAINLSPL